MAEAPSVGPWYARLGGWVGVGTAPGALITGGGIAEGRSLRTCIIGIGIGVALVAGLAVANGALGQRRREATAGLAADAFGQRAGPRTVVVLITLGVSCWSGFYVGIATGAFGTLVGLPSWLFAPVVGLALWCTHGAGFRRWNVLVAVTAAASMAVAAVTYAGVPRAAVGSAPDSSGAGQLLFVVGLVVAYAAVFAVRSPDFTWDAAHLRDVVVSGGALVLTMLAFLGLGVAIYLRAGSWDLADLVNRTRWPAAGALLLLLSIYAPAVSGLHSGGLGLNNAFGIPESIGAAVVAVVGTVLGALRVDLYLLPILAVLGAVVPPVLSVLLLRTARHEDWQAWAAWGAGSSISLLALALRFPAHVLLGIGSTALLMLLALVLPSRRLALTGRLQ